MAQANPYLSRILKLQENLRQQTLAPGEARYTDILGQYKTLAGTTSSALGQVPGMYQNLADAYGRRAEDFRGDIEGGGAIQREELARREQQQLGELNVRQGGLAGSYVAGLSRGIRSDAAFNQMRLEESLRQQRLGYLSKLTGEQLAAQGMVPQATAQTALQQMQVGERPLQFEASKQDQGFGSQYTQTYGKLADLLGQQANIGTGGLYKPYGTVSSLRQ